MQDKSEQEEHEYRGWKIKITDKAGLSKLMDAKTYDSKH